MIDNSGMGKKQCILVAHDWGGVVGYGVCVAYPEMVSRYVACNIPHPRSVRDEQEQSWKQRLMSWYMLFFQCPIIPEFYLSHDDFALLDGIVKDTKASNLEEVAEAYKYAFRNESELIIMKPFLYVMHGLLLQNLLPPPSITTDAALNTLN